MMRIAKVTTVCIAVLVSFTVNISASIITIHITAEVTHLGDPDDLLEGKVTVGDTITGSYTCDPDTLDDNSSETLGAYWHYDTPCGINLSIGGFNFQTDPDSVLFLAEVGNNDLYSIWDHLLFRSHENLPLSNGVEVNWIDWQLYDSSGTALSSDALPTTPPLLQDWENNYLYISFGQQGSSSLAAKVTAAVPEPATILLLALGSLLLTRRR